MKAVVPLSRISTEAPCPILRGTNLYWEKGLTGVTLGEGKRVRGGKVEWLKVEGYEGCHWAGEVD